MHLSEQLTRYDIPEAKYASENRWRDSHARLTNITPELRHLRNKGPNPVRDNREDLDRSGESQDDDVVTASEADSSQADEPVVTDEPATKPGKQDAAPATSSYSERQDAIFRADGLTPSQKALLYAINWCQRANDVGWPSVATLQTAAGLSRSGVQKARRELAAMGILHVKQGGGRSSSDYTINVAELQTRSLSKRVGRTGKAPPANSVSPSSAPSKPEVTNRKQKEPPKERAGENSKLQSPTEAWQHVCDSVKQYHYLYDSDRLRAVLSDSEQTAAKGAGGLSKIANRDRYTETKVRNAFLAAYRCR